jgi:dipeptidyl aminopeptidase/acylaminoacyl peptidase
MKTRLVSFSVALTALIGLSLTGCATSSSSDQSDDTAETAATSSDNPRKKRTISAKPPSEMPQLIDRSVLFGNPDRVSVRVSPDGQKLGWLAPHNGVLNVFVAPADKPDQAEPVTDAKDEPISNFQWAYTSSDILYLQDDDGNEQYHLYRTNLESGDTKDLTPMDGIQARVQQLSPERPTEALVAINKRNPRLHDIYRIDLKSGDRTLVQKNTKGFAGFVTTESFEIKLGAKSLPDGGVNYLKPVSEQGETTWKPYLKLTSEDSMSTSIVGFSKDGQTLYLTDSRGRNTAALVSVPYAGESSKTNTLAAHDKANVSNVYLDPETHTPQAAVADYTRDEWLPVEEDFKPHIAKLNEIAGDGEATITSRSRDDSIWTVSVVQDDGPVKYYTYDPSAQKASFLFVHRSELKGLPLVDMEPVVIESRDGLDLVSYLSLPPGVETTDDSDLVPKQQVPMIVHVHGGPWSRVSWGYHSIHQWLTNRGYAVLSVNFRGSTGFGKDFVNAGNKEWGAKMHDDILDARQWAIDKGITAADSVGIFGGSYGGYATLVGMTMTPDKFAVGIDIVGPSNLLTLMNSVPPYWKPMLSMFHTRVGDPNTKEGKKMLQERSPLNYVDQIQNPLLIAQGANDPRVKRAESDQIVRAAMTNNVPVTYALYPDEGHGFSRPGNKMSFYAVAEHFLRTHLGGRAQQLSDIFDGSSIQIPVGADDLPTVQETLCAPNPDRCGGGLSSENSGDSQPSTESSSEATSGQRSN